MGAVQVCIQSLQPPSARFFCTDPLHSSAPLLCTPVGADTWPLPLLQIAVFELLKAFVITSPNFGANVNTLQAEAAFGAIGGLVGAVITTPADVITTRIITSDEAEAEPTADGAEGDEGVGQADEASPLQVARAILDESGPGGFFVGVGSRGLYWAPAIGIFLSLYCSLRQLALGLVAS